MEALRVQFAADELNEKSGAAILRIEAKQKGIVRHERIMPRPGSRGVQPAFLCISIPEKISGRKAVRQELNIGIVPDNKYLCRGFMIVLQFRHGGVVPINLKRVPSEEDEPQQVFLP